MLGAARGPSHRSFTVRTILWSIAVGLVSLGNPLWAAPPPKPQRKLVLQAPPALAVDSVVVSPDGSLVATASEGGVRLYDAKSGAFLRGIGEVGDRGIVFSPD